MGQDNHNDGMPQERDGTSDSAPEPDGDSSGTVPGPPTTGALPGRPPTPFGQPDPLPSPPPAWGSSGPPHNPWEHQGQQWGSPGMQQPGQPGWSGQPQQPGQPWGSPGFPQQSGWTPPPKPGVIPLRPLGLGELLDGAFQACRKNAAATFGIALLIQAVISVLALFVTRGILSPELLGGDFSTDAELSEELIFPTLTSTTLLTVAAVVGVLLLQGVLVLPVARSILNLKTGFAQTWKLSSRSLLPLAGLGVLLTALVLAGLVAFAFLLVLIVDVLGAAGIPVVILGVLALIAVFLWLGVKLALAPAALVLERVGIFASLRRSWQLTRRNFWRSLGILALTALLVGIVSSVITTPVTLLISFVGAFGSGGEPGPGTTAALLAVNVAVTAFFSAIGYAFQAAVTSLLYVDLRIRREGFDLELMKQQELVGGPADADLVPGRGRDPRP